MVFYRKYRPQTLDDLIGQDGVKSTIIESFKTDKLSHAYLFVGPRGTGKTSTARILAKMVNCEAKNAPCNKCQTCLSITDGSNLDLIEIDAASNRGIDDVRSLRENIKLSPSGNGKKVYIIDEIHMLTTEAFNALLKTLEEPPSHVLFILATTEANKVPQTILSRVTRLDFKMAKITDIVKALRIVAEGEKIKIDDEALKILAQKADGSFRDGVKLLDQVAASGKIRAKDITDGLQIAPFDSLIELLEFLAKDETKEALACLNKQLERASVKDLNLQLMEVLRAGVYIKNGLENLVKEDFDSIKFEKLIFLAAKFSMGDLVMSLDALQKAWEKLKVTSISSLPLELAVVEICRDGLSDIKAPLDTPVVETNEDARGSAISVIASDAKQSITKTDQNKQGDVLVLQEKWTFILETIKPYNFSLEALLRSVKIQSCEAGLVVLEVPYSFHQRILEAQKSKDLLESVFSNVLSKSVKVSTTLGARPARLEDIANIEVAADDEIISLASEIFNGKLVD